MGKIPFYIFLIITSFFFVGFSSQVYASDFLVDINRELVIDSAESIETTETRTIHNNSANRLITKENNETFQIIVIDENEDKLQPSFLSAQTFIDGKIVQNKQGSEDTGHTEVLIPYNSSIGIGQSKEFKIIYNNYGLIKTTGALLDIFSPGFGKDYKFDNGTTSYKYQTTIKINRNLGEVGFVVPTPVETLVEGNYYVYKISPESLIGSKIWVQIGKTQYYQFTLSQPVKASSAINKGYFNEYSLVIPRDITEAETIQRVFFKNLDPIPKQVVADEEGNLIATFKMPSHQDGVITVEGYAEVSKINQQASRDNAGVLDDIDIQEMTKYLNPSQFWEVDHPEIQKRASELKSDKKNIYEIIESDYSHIIDTIDYSEVKRFGINNRQGALKTLQGGAAVCMEYSDLFLALSRAQGIPTRAAYGYGYDARIGENQQDAHQWVQVYLPGLKEWLSVDVTWGESGPALIGGDLNHFYTHVAVADPNSPPSIERVSYGKQVDLASPDFEITVIKQLPKEEILSTSADILTKYPKVEKNQLELWFDNLTLRIQTANIPASLSRNANYMIYTGFALFVLTGLLILQTIFGSLFKRIKTKHKISKEGTTL